MSDADLFLSAQDGQLAVDVLETRDAIIIRSAVAGIKPEDLHIHVEGDLVTIRGERKHKKEIHDATVHYEECFWGTFSRSIILPHAVKPEEADATFTDGVLELTIPKTRGEMDVKVRDLSA